MMKIQRDHLDAAAGVERFCVNLLSCAITLFTLFVGGASHADNLFLPKEQTGRGGKLLHIDQNEIHFQLGCKGAAQKYPAQVIDTAVHFNSRCKNTRIDAIGGDDPGCGPETVNGPNFRGMKEYFGVKARNDMQYALKSISFEDDLLKGQLLISSKAFSIKRAEIDTLFRSEDCYYKTMTR